MRIRSAAREPSSDAEADGVTDSVSGVARRYAGALGWSVFPVRTDKRPAIGSWEPYQSRQPSDAELEDWFGNSSEPAGVAVVTGAISKTVVVDVDGTDGEMSVRDLKLPRTVTAITGKGRHYYFRHPGGRVGNAVRLLPGVDVRGDGGYVVAPPSRHASGRHYAWAPSCSPFELDLAPLPKWAMPAARPRVDGEGSESGQVIPAGVRNDRLASIAGAMRRKGLTASEIEAVLIVVNHRCSPPLPEDEVRGIAASVSRYAPGPSTPVAANAGTGESRCGLSDVLETFHRYLEIADDAGIILALATIVAHRLGGDPVWLFLVSPPSGGKTEILNALAGLPEVYRLSTLTASTFASGFVPKGKAAAGDRRRVSLLYRLADAGKTVVVMKDFTTVLSMNRDSRQEVLSQLREVFDGSFTKDFGTGESVSGEGRLAVIPASRP